MIQGGIKDLKTYYGQVKALVLRSKKELFLYLILLRVWRILPVIKVKKISDIIVRHATLEDVYDQFN